MYRILELRQAQFAIIQLCLRQQCAFGFVRQLGFQFGAAIAHRCQIQQGQPQRFFPGLPFGLGIKQFSVKPVHVFIRRCNGQGQGPDFQLQIIAHRLQGIHIPAQPFDLRQTRGDSFPVGLDFLIGGEQRLFRALGPGSDFPQTQSKEIAFLVGGLQRRRQLGDRGPHFLGFPAFHGQQLGQLFDLIVQAQQCFVAAGDGLGQKEMRQHEHHQQKHDDQQQRRQSVDETGPNIVAAGGASASHRFIRGRFAVRLF